jgi:hypothetical protein
MVAYLVQELPDWAYSGGLAAIQAALDLRASEGWYLRDVVGRVAYFDDVPGGGSGTPAGEYLPLTGGVLTGPMGVPAGTAAIPSIQVGAANNGVMAQAGDFVCISIQGQIRFRVGPTGPQALSDLDANNYKVTRIANATLPTDALNMQTGDARYAPAATARAATAGAVMANGTLIEGPQGWSVERTSPGQYTISHYLGLPYGVGLAMSGTGGPGFIQLASSPENSFDVRTYSQAGSLQDHDFEFTVALIADLPAAGG